MAAALAMAIGSVISVLISTLAGESDRAKGGTRRRAVEHTRKHNKGHSKADKVTRSR